MAVNNSLINLYKLTSTGYILKFKEPNEFKNFYQPNENKLYNNLEDIKEIIDTLEEKYNVKNIYSIEEDIKNIMEINPVIRRINSKLQRIFYNKKQPNSDRHTNVIFDAFREQFLMIDYIETKIRTFFYHLLSNHLKASNGQAEIYHATLKIISDELIFINDDERLLFDIEINYNPIYLDQNNVTEFMNNYLIDLVKKILLNVTSYTDLDLEDNNNYAYAISYQILLRSIFLILDDNTILAYLNEYFNSIKIENNTIINGIITTAFIANYSDEIDYKKLKRKKNENN